MVKFKLLCQRLEDIRINQLERILDSLRYFTLCPDSNRDRTWMPEEFIETVKDACRKATSVIVIFNLVGYKFIYTFSLLNNDHRKYNREIGFWRMESLN